MLAYMSTKRLQQNGKVFPSGGKGVGGYRPVVNWREISFRKKRIADRQILLFVLSSGFGIVCIGVLLLSLALFVIGTRCPNNWTMASERCLHLSAFNVSWFEAKAFCVEQGAGMLELRTSEDVADFSGSLKRLYWIGFSRSIGDGSFSWESGSPSDVNNFQSNTAIPPQNNISECVYVLPTGEWKVAESCYNAFSIACVYSKSYSPLILIGPVFILCGALVMIMSIELCHRNRGVSKKTNFLQEKQKIPKKAITGIDNSAFKSEPAPTDPPFIQPSVIPPSASQVQVAEAEQNVAQADLVANLISQVSDQSPGQDQLELLLSPKNLS